MYPTKIEANGNIYNINTDYRIALACFRALNDEEITDLERFYAVETLLLGENVLEEDEEILQDKIGIYLRCGKEENTNNNEIDFDYVQDETITKTSIRQCYHIDLNNIDYMHWYEYNELISGLTSESVLNKIRELRSYNVNDIKDINEKNRILKAKESVALNKKKQTFSKEEEKNINEFYKKIGLEKKE